MKASEADQFKKPPAASSADASAVGGHAHAQPAEGEHHHGEGGHDHGEGGGHSSMMESKRCVDYQGHKIEITTCYEITVDGKPVSAHLSVRDDGKLHTHAFPNYVFPSAVDVVKKLIDLFPEDFDSGQQGHGHGGHTHEHS